MDIILEENKESLGRKLMPTQLVMMNVGVEFAEASITDEELLEQAIKDNIECVVNLPNSARDYH